MNAPLYIVTLIDWTFDSPDGYHTHLKPILRITLHQWRELAWCLMHNRSCAELAKHWVSYFLAQFPDTRNNVTRFLWTDLEFNHESTLCVSLRAGDKSSLLLILYCVCAVKLLQFLFLWDRPTLLFSGLRYLPLWFWKLNWGMIHYAEFVKLCALCALSVRHFDYVRVLPGDTLAVCFTPGSPYQ